MVTARRNFFVWMCVWPGVVFSDRAAGAAPVLVELFTSQGCSSCPAADAFVRDLPRLGYGRDRVIPLAFHVDYWDDLGWKDPFASPAFSERQRRYLRDGVLVAPEGGSAITGAYTPQMIVGGRVHFSGGRRDVALKEIRSAEERPADTALSGDVHIQGDVATIAARLSSSASPASQAWFRLIIALAARSASTRVQNGENAGETLSEAAIVRVLSDPIPITAGPRNVVHVQITKPRNLDWDAVELTAFVQSARTMRIEAARALVLPLHLGGP
jgi:hypothetical protein